jgi:hypothetical protein
MVDGVDRFQPAEVVFDDQHGAHGAALLESEIIIIDAECIK